MTHPESGSEVLKTDQRGRVRTSPEAAETVAGGVFPERAFSPEVRRWKYQRVSMWLVMDGVTAWDKEALTGISAGCR